MSLNCLNEIFASSLGSAAFYILFVLVLLFGWYLVSQRKPPHFPPGPWGFPLLGHLPLLGLEPHKTALKWKAKYGPVVGFDFGSYRAVIISDYKLAKEAWSDPAFAGRPQLEMYTARSGGHNLGILMSQGRSWREQRQFTQRTLRELGGFGTRSIEGLIVEQGLELVARLREEVRSGDGNPIKIHGRFNVPAINVLWSILAGSPFAHDDPELSRIIQAACEGFSEGDLFTNVGVFIPWFGRNFPDWITQLSKLEKQYKPVLDFVQPYIKEHWATHVRGQPRDFMDAYIDEIKKTNDPESSFHSRWKKYNLGTVILDIVLAGGETAGVSMEWICLMLASYPDVQEKVATEIDNILGRRAPCLEDRKNMPYTDAVLHEIWRYKPLFTLGPFHSTVEDVHFHGFEIPKGTVAFINMHEAHFNKELWGDPDNFRPERWLKRSADGSQLEFVRHEGFMPFSVGKRVCMGEQLARDELFLFTVALCQAFRLELDPKSARPSLEGKMGGTTVGPKPYQLVIRER